VERNNRVRKTKGGLSYDRGKSKLKKHECVLFGF